MPSALTYPGVYVEEIPSGVRTITGVATSITAFVGRALRGPTDKAVTLNSFGDFETIFGGLWIGSALGFAVRDFFLNGGGQAVVVRLYNLDPGEGEDDRPRTTYDFAVGNVKLIASSPGQWGVGLRAKVDKVGITDEIAAALGVAKADVFNLTITDTKGGQAERFANLTLKDTSRRADRVLLANSQLVRYNGTPDATKTPLEGDAEEKLDALGTLESELAVLKGKLTDKQNSGASDVTAEKTAVADKKKALDDAIRKLTTKIDGGALADMVSDGVELAIGSFLPANGETDKKGLYALEQTDLFNLLNIPPYKPGTQELDVDVNLIAAAGAYCERRRAMLIVDPPKNWISKSVAKEKFTDTANDNVGSASRNAALFFPRLRKANPLRDNQIEDFAPGGSIAGIFARTDAQRGVWKAPAGLDATIVGASGLSLVLTDAENGELNPLGINVLRSFPGTGRVVWGSRTLRGSDQLADEYKYIPVRRTALFIEESLFRGLKWVVFEPNDEPLWAQIRLNVGAFMHNLFRQGAFQGSSPRDAYFVKCDKETTTQNDINLGIVNVVVGFAPLKPAEFVVIKLQQIADQIEV